MLVSLNWLKEYVSINMSYEALSDALTMAGFEVESFYESFPHLNNVVIGRVIKVEPHPNADRLQLCTVDIGKETLSIVCGAPNVKENMLAPLALIGAVMKDGTVLKKTKIRGETSYGMLCSAIELGLGTDKSGIMDLNKYMQVGELLKDALHLSDTIFDINITPNRPDCLSMIGIAREIAAMSNEKLIYPDYEIPAHKPDNETDTDFKTDFKIGQLASVTIKDTDLCNRYAAKIVKNIKVKESPEWLRAKLLLAGLKPINNIVDITNFVMLETGQPLHAFDLDIISQKQIIVRKAEKKQNFVTLDSKERKILPDMLMICDAQKPVAIAGVMGGENSEIKEHTKDILIESAYFKPTSIRKTSKKLNISTDSSYRFERGIDPDGTVRALNRAALLMAELAEGSIVNGLIDEQPVINKNDKVTISIDYANSLLGTNIDKNRIKNLLESIELEAVEDEKDADKLSVTAPSFRVDITRQADIIEEIARLYGYDNINATFPSIIPNDFVYSDKQAFCSRIKEIMTGLGFYETINYSFISLESEENLNLIRSDYVKILNPISQDMSIMRTSLMPSLLKTAYRNISHNIKTLKIFETGKIFLAQKDDDLPFETDMLSALWTGSRKKASWHEKEIETNFYDIKGALEALLKALHITDVKFSAIEPSECSFIKAGYCAHILINENVIGSVGEVSESVLNNHDIKQKAFAFELNLDMLRSNLPDIVSIKDIPKFPGIDRDITLILNKDIIATQIFDFVNNINQRLIEKAYLLDVYEGEPIPSDKKSVCLRIDYRADDKTLTQEAINPIHDSIVKKLLKKFDAALPV
jgi:phenylalanyl-tRNA synthetase beta chain